jgi:hypothetical protein
VLAPTQLAQAEQLRHGKLRRLEYDRLPLGAARARGAALDRAGQQARLRRVRVRVRVRVRG